MFICFLFKSSALYEGERDKDVILGASLSEISFSIVQEFVKPAFASGHQVHKVALCNVEGDCAMILKNNVKGLKGIAIASRW